MDGDVTIRRKEALVGDVANTAIGRKGEGHVVEARGAQTDVQFGCAVQSRRFRFFISTVIFAL